METESKEKITFMCDGITDLVNTVDASIAEVFTAFEIILASSAHMLDTREEATKQLAVFFVRTNELLQQLYKENGKIDGNTNQET